MLWSSVGDGFDLESQSHLQGLSFGLPSAIIYKNVAEEVGHN